MKTESSFLKPLDTIQEVETPPFLLTRIHQRIEAIKANQISPKLAWGLAVSFSFLLIMNMVILNGNRKEKHENNLVESLHISTNNDLYK